MKVFACAIFVVSSLFLTVMPVSANSAAGQGAKASGPTMVREAPRPKHRQHHSASQRKQRLSAEERRALRRDIKAADQQIYRPKRKGNAE